MIIICHVVLTNCVGLEDKINGKPDITIDKPGKSNSRHGITNSKHNMIKSEQGITRSKHNIIIGITLNSLVQHK